jgi:predicted flap endonuclease-1-like 5' DNA nuclease
MGILRWHVPVVEEASIDEAYMDLTFTGSLEEAKKLCESIKKEIRESEQLTASVGIGPNKLIAKIASGAQKPDGMTLVAEGAAARFLANLPIRIIPGIGPKTEVLLRERGVEIVRDLRKFTREELQSLRGNGAWICMRRCEDAMSLRWSRSMRSSPLASRRPFWKTPPTRPFCPNGSGRCAKTSLHVSANADSRVSEQ